MQSLDVSIKLFLLTFKKKINFFISFIHHFNSHTAKVDPPILLLKKIQVHCYHLPDKAKIHEPKIIIQF